MIPRLLATELTITASYFPVVVVVGPRQSGKTTLVQLTFPQHYYVTLEDFDLRREVLNDPRGFLERNVGEKGIILDEFQHVPELLSYIQTFVDRKRIPGQIILTGSQNFLMNQAITQSLAGRVGIITLLPLSLQELSSAKLLTQEVETIVFNGCYPGRYAYDIPPTRLYPNYIASYIERDIRAIKNITNLMQFQKFMALCAGRIGQILNFSSLANDCDISVPTAKAWMSLLEACYIVVTIYPHYKNFSKRLIKSPKLYFYDTGIACSLLGIESVEQLNTHYLRGNLIESLIVSDILKNFLNKGKKPSLYFWRDQSGHEVDGIIEQGETLIPLEIKASKTLNASFFDGIAYWNKLAGYQAPHGFVVYSGDQGMQLAKGTLVSWRSIATLF